MRVNVAVIKFRLEEVLPHACVCVCVCTYTGGCGMALYAYEL